MATMKTPGVYIVEKNAFPNSVVEVATAVPAFIGYTQKADNHGKSLCNKPWRISSMAEFHNYFGFGPEFSFSIDELEDDANEDSDLNFNNKDYVLKQIAGKYLLYRSMRLFYQNGGGPCYIVSVGNYTDKITAEKLQGGIEPLEKEQEPTLLVIPETVLLSKDDSSNLQKKMLEHCGSKMRNRFAILDIWGGYRERHDASGDCIDHFRNAIGINNLDFAAAYYPWLNTTIIQLENLSYENIANADVLQKLLLMELENKSGMTIDEAKKIIEKEKKAVEKNPKIVKKVLTGREIDQQNSVKYAEKILDDFQQIMNTTSSWDDVAAEEVDAEKRLLNKYLLSTSPLLNQILKVLKSQLNLLPPAAAMAGIYTMVDNSRGVWKAPANVSISAVVSPSINISHEEQEDLNISTQGKSINAIRTFVGEGTLVWGARTLDGNSLDWRYINVRRTMIMLEESIRLATKAYVFEPNTANTWITIKSMIENFLTGVWKRGGVAGSVPEDAFSVRIGLGETMTPQDILDGVLKVSVLIAATRPAEFIEITFQQQMQKS